ncbi:hypothetical protein B0I08_101323 [Glaciihabitans tibetensis]|uniref:Uncharacterized protein n=1 Tax=Glaciihabitans tibetensis TaxID=1266600 RepID=A0A2T0VJB8_9MICO|nr:hypothetical protein [Glaciihabitans tibetensis]PRY70195.1 hypothetical protein B0I08_101323 [Glaciihabitans tibetensis]
MTRLDRHTGTALTANGTQLALQSAGVTLDEGWSPYVQATLTASIPDDLDGLNPLDDDRVQVTLTQSFTASQPVSAMSAAWAGEKLSGLAGTYATVAHMSAQFGLSLNTIPIPATTRTFLLGIRSRTIDHLAGTMVLTLASDEARAQDAKRLSTVALAPFTRSLHQAVQFGLATIGASVIINAPDFVLEVDATEWLPGVSVWDWLAPMVQAAGYRLFSDERGVWRLTTSPYEPGGTLELSPSTGLIQSPETISRESDWYDGTVIEYTGDGFPRYDIAAVGFSRTRLLSLPTRYPGPGAAAAVNQRNLARGITLSPRAVSNYDATPGQALTVELPGIYNRSGFLSAVSFALPDSVMTVTPRDITN